MTFLCSLKVFVRKNCSLAEIHFVLLIGLFLLKQNISSSFVSFFEQLMVFLSFIICLIMIIAIFFYICFLFLFVVKINMKSASYPLRSGSLWIILCTFSHSPLKPFENFLFFSIHQYYLSHQVCLLRSVSDITLSHWCSRKSN